MDKYMLCGFAILVRDYIVPSIMYVLPVAFRQHFSLVSHSNLVRSDMVTKMCWVLLHYSTYVTPPSYNLRTLSETKHVVRNCNDVNLFTNPFTLLVVEIIGKIFMEGICSDLPNGRVWVFCRHPVRWESGKCSQEVTYVHSSCFTLKHKYKQKVTFFCVNNSFAVVQQLVVANSWRTTPSGCEATVSRNQREKVQLFRESLITLVHSMKWMVEWMDEKHAWDGCYRFVGLRAFTSFSFGCIATT